MTASFDCAIWRSHLFQKGRNLGPEDESSLRGYTVPKRTLSCGIRQDNNEDYATWWQTRQAPRSLGASSASRCIQPPPSLSGPGNVTALRNDGYLFFTVRDGASVMPGYGYGMMDHEVWSLVAYLRTMEDTAYTAPVEVAE